MLCVLRRRRRRKCVRKLMGDIYIILNTSFSLFPVDIFGRKVGQLQMEINFKTTFSALENRYIAEVGALSP